MSGYYFVEIKHIDVFYSKIYAKDKADAESRAIKQLAEEKPGAIVYKVSIEAEWEPRQILKKALNQ